MKELTIRYNNYQDEFSSLDLHDAEIRDFCCSYDRHEIEIPLITHVPGKKSSKSILKFLEVINFNITFNEPWGPGVYINEFKINESMNEVSDALKFELLLNSGDKLTIIAMKVTYQELDI
jgi:hypothetical protein